MYIGLGQCCVEWWVLWIANLKQSETPQCHYAYIDNTVEQFNFPLSKIR
jgi:hypothetical protein